MVAADLLQQILKLRRQKLAKQLGCGVSSIHGVLSEVSAQ
jgi:hypothetical protein